MGEKITQILNDLYILAPELRNREDELKKLISNLILAKPDAAVDSKFVADLRAKLTPESQKTRILNNLFNNIRNLFIMKPTKLAVAGGLLAIAIVLPTYLALKDGRPMIDKDYSLSAKISKRPASAFGSLAMAEAGSGVRAEELSTRAQISPATIEANTVTGDAAVSQVAPPGLGGGAGVSAKIAPDAMIWPGPTQYTFKYTGGELETLPTTLPVYRRLKNSEAKRALGAYVAGFNNGLIDLSKFTNTELRSLELVESGSKGYAISLNLEDSSASIGQNWETWPQAIACAKGDCSIPPMNINEIPNDETIISIADAFLRKYQINVTNYDRPVVENNWRIEYERATDKSLMWVPDMISVVYPLKISNQPVYDMSGNPQGLRVNINVRDKVATGAWNVTSQSYEESNYNVETDKSKIIAIAERGGQQGVYYFGETGQNKADTVNLGKPTLSLVQYWTYENGRGQELYVPAYIFPIENAPTGFPTWQKYVVVPLPKEILDRNDFGGGPIIMKDAVPESAVRQ